jgi:hypothetical protein
MNARSEHQSHHFGYLINTLIRKRSASTASACCARVQSALTSGGGRAGGFCCSDSACRSWYSPTPSVTSDGAADSAGSPCVVSLVRFVVVTGL